MIKSVLLAMLGTATLAGVAAAQTLKSEKYTLPNGMVVILHEDHTLPTVSVNLWYRVGARNEPPQRSGFAHLFEHLMFMGTRRVPDNRFDVLMESGGGANNATTSLDRTNYYSWGPSELLPTLLWLDADRLERMGLDMTQAKLDKQRDVVRNERRQGVENTPYGKADDASYQLLYLPSHPYHNGVIGTHRDLESAQLQDVRDFFATFYVPENTSLVVAGDFDAKAIKPTIAGLFGSLPRGNAPSLEKVPEVKLEGVIRSTSLDKVELPQLSISYHSPGLYKDGDAECDLIAGILGQGKNSRLYKRLILTDQSAVEVSAEQASSMLGSVFRVTVQAKPRADLAAIERAVDQEIRSLIESGPTREELQNRKAQFEFAKVSPLQSMQAVADRLNEYEFYFREPDSLERDLGRYRKVGRESIMQWGRKVLTPGARLIQIVLPEQPAGQPGPRDNRPLLAASAAFAPAAPDRFRLSNGIEVQLWSRPKQRGGLPLASARVVFARPRRAVDDVAQAGRAGLLASMLSEGTGDLDGSAFAAAMQALAASFGAGAQTEAFSASVSGLSRTFDQAIALWARAIREPRLAESDFTRVKALHLEDLAQSEQEPSLVASRVAFRLLMGDVNPYGRPVSGTPRSVDGLGLAQIRALHEQLLRPEHATVLIAGDLAIDQAKAVLEKHLGTWQPKASPAPLGAAVDFTIPRQAAMRVAIVDRPSAVQTAIVFAAPGAALSDANRPSFDLLGTILGGSFTSRLMQNLRERHGYTYGARASFGMAPSLGWFVARSNVRSDVTGASLAEFIKEFARLRSGDASGDETTKAARTARQDMVQAIDTLSGLLGQAETLLVGGLPWDTLSADLQRVARTSAAELNRLAPSAIQTDRAVLVLVGDKRTILPQLKGLGLATPIEVNAWGGAKAAAASTKVTSSL